MSKKNTLHSGDPLTFLPWFDLGFVRENSLFFGLSVREDWMIRSMQDAIQAKRRVFNLDWQAVGLP